MRVRGYGDFKVISPDNHFLAASSDTIEKRSSNSREYITPTIFVMDYKDGHLIKMFEEAKDQVIGTSDHRYAMDFSPDSKYFACVTYDHIDTLSSLVRNKKYTLKLGNKVVLYDTETWEKVWEKNIP